MSEVFCAPWTSVYTVHPFSPFLTGINDLCASVYVFRDEEGRTGFHRNSAGVALLSKLGQAAYSWKTPEQDLIKCTSNDSPIDILGRRKFPENVLFIAPDRSLLETLPELRKWKLDEQKRVLKQRYTLNTLESCVPPPLVWLLDSSRLSVETLQWTLRHAKALVCGLPAASEFGLHIGIIVARENIGALSKDFIISQHQVMMEQLPSW